VLQQQKTHKKCIYISTLIYWSLIHFCSITFTLPLFGFYSCFNW